MRFGKKPEDLLYTGDTIFDIREAREAGVHSACVCNGYHERGDLEKEEPEFILEALSEIKKLETI